MKNLREKMRKQGGFTLIEMLIVVAIIAILIAISIPLVSTALESSREATDAANERSFKAELMICYMTKKVGEDDFETDKIYVYDAESGSLDTDAPDDAYGQATSAKGATDYEHQGKFLWGYVNAQGDVYMTWSATALTSTDNINNQELCGGSAMYKTTATSPETP